MSGHIEDQKAELVAKMRKLGLTDYEARILIVLVRRAPATAYELAKASGVPRPNAYSALESLQERGAVMPVSAKPVRYVALEPERFFGLIATRTQAICDELASGFDAFAAPERDIYVWNLEGEAIVDQKVAELIDSATTDIWLKGDTALLERHKDGLRRAAAKRGVALMIILFGTNPEDYQFTERCQVLIHEASGIRMGTADNLFTIVVDHTEMLTANEEGAIRAAHTQNQAVVKMALSLIRHDYYMAEIFKRFKDELDAGFGPHLALLRRRSYTENQIASFSEKTGISDDAAPRAASRSSR